jgi:hypothetical protein
MPNTTIMIQWLSILGSLASLVAIPVAIIQTIRMHRIKLERYRKTWTQISSVKALMRHLEAEKSDSAYGLVCQQFRDMLNEAVLLEKGYSAETIKKWRKTGKLSSDWQE